MHIVCSVRDATQSPRKSAFFSSLNIGEGGGKTLILGKFKLMVAKMVEMCRLNIIM